MNNELSSGVGGKHECDRFELICPLSGGLFKGRGEEHCGRLVGWANSPALCPHRMSGRAAPASPRVINLSQFRTDLSRDHSIKAGLK